MSENFLLDDYLKEHMLAKPPGWYRPVGESVPAVPGLSRWVPKSDIPAVGSRVNILAWRERAEDRGVPGTVLGYQDFSGFLMVWVRPDWRPQWHIKDNPGRWASVFAGIELEPV